MLRALLIGVLALAQEPAPPDEQAALSAIAQAAQALKTGDASTPDGADANQKQIGLILDAAAAFPQSLPVNLKAAEALIAAGESKPALIPANRAVVIRRSAATLTQRGTARFGTQAYAGALEDCKAALKLEPRHFGAFSLCKMAEGRGSSTSPQPSQTQSQPPQKSHSSPQPNPAASNSGSGSQQALSVSGSNAPATAWQAIQPARNRLRASKLGREIDDFMAAKGVQFAYEQNLEANTGAVWNPRSKTIGLPPNVGAIDPTEAAVTLAHEGFHAIQTIEKSMEASIELEEDAYFRSMVVYHEMLRAGIPPSRPHSPIALDYQDFSQSITAGKPGKFTRLIKTRYADDRVSELKRRKLLGWLWEMLDADFLRNRESIAYQRNKFWNVLGLERGPLDETSKKHHEEIRWQRAWIKAHRKEFP